MTSGKAERKSIMSVWEKEKNQLPLEGNSYRTARCSVSLLARLFPSLVFYGDLLTIVFTASGQAKRNQYGNQEWAWSSLAVLHALERVGVVFEITGIDHYRNLDGPCVLISNHMSTLETFVLPALIQPLRDVTFVVKQSLLDYPVFKYVMRSRNPITVGRTNPRDDLRAVLDGGTERLKSGRSLIIFPQTTRTFSFDPEQFNTLGVKLAKRAGVPIIPIALKSDAWGTGSVIKDFGRIDPSKIVHFAFGEPLLIRDRGTEEHQKVIEFISARLNEWSGEAK